jgi:hypothetical protein
VWRCPAKVAIVCSSQPIRPRSVRHRCRVVCVENRGTSGGQGNPSYHLRPCPQDQRLGAIAAELRQEQRSACPVKSRPVCETVRQQHSGRSRVGHDPLGPILRRLRPDPQDAVGGVEIVGARAQLLTAQRGRRPGRASPRLRTGSTAATVRMAAHCPSVGIHGSFVNRGTNPR